MMFQTPNPCNRRAVAAVEFAVTLPLIVLLLFSAVELGRAIMVQHALQEASQCACRIYSMEETTQQSVLQKVEEMMSAEGIAGYTVTFQPSLKTEVDEFMEPVTVRISVPSENVSWLGESLTSGFELTGIATLPANVGDVDSDDGQYNITDDDHVGDGFERDDDAGDGDDDD